MYAWQGDGVINGKDFIYNPADFEDHKTNTDNTGNTPEGRKDVNTDLYNTIGTEDPEDYTVGMSNFGKVSSMPVDSRQNGRQNGVHIKERGTAKAGRNEGDASLGVTGQGEALFSGDY